MIITSRSCNIWLRVEFYSMRRFNIWMQELDVHCRCMSKLPLRWSTVRVTTPPSCHCCRAEEWPTDWWQISVGRLHSQDSWRTRLDWVFRAPRQPNGHHQGSAWVPGRVWSWLQDHERPARFMATGWAGMSQSCQGLWDVGGVWMHSRWGGDRFTLVSHEIRIEPLWSGSICRFAVCNKL